MDPIEKLAALFLKFPGIGKRQSKRFVYYLLGADQRYIKELAQGIAGIKSMVFECSSCHRFFTAGNKQKSLLCNICESTQTDRSTLMIVEKDVDLLNMEKSGAYHGLYFVLGGTLPFLYKEPHLSIRSKELTKKVMEILKPGDLKEIIFAFSATPESEYTVQYVKGLLESLTAEQKIKITVLGRGLSTGTELEYSDAETLKSAIKNRA